MAWTVTVPCCPAHGWLSTRSLPGTESKPFAPWAVLSLGCVLTPFFSDDGVWESQANSLAC